MPDKEDYEIMVVAKSAIFSNNNLFTGYHSISESPDFESIINKNHIFTMRYADAENNENLVQPVCYTALVNNATKKVFLYKRSKKDKDYGERRLQGKYSIGLGGHVERQDTNSSNPLRESLEREVFKEEVEVIGNYSKPKLLGYIYDDSNKVGRVHFGLLYYAETDALSVFGRDPEITKEKFVTIKALEAMCRDSRIKIENWTRIALKPISELMSDLSRP